MVSWQEESAMNSEQARNLEKQRAAADGVGTLMMDNAIGVGSSVRSLNKAAKYT